MANEKTPLTVWDGVWLTLGAIALLGLLVVSAATPHFEAMMKEMGNGHIPRMTRLVFKAGMLLRVGVPAVLLLGFVGSVVMRLPTALRAAIAIITALVAVLWLYALYEPIFSIAGNIR